MIIYRVSAIFKLYLTNNLIYVISKTSLFLINQIIAYTLNSTCSKPKYEIM